MRRRCSGAAVLLLLLLLSDVHSPLCVPFCFSERSLSSLSLSLSGCLYKSPSVCVLCMRAQGVCVRQARGTNECLYSVEATGRRIGGQGLPSPPSNPTLPHSSVGRETPLLPPSARLHLFRGHPLLHPPSHSLSLPSQEKGWCKVSSKRRKRRRGSERAGPGGVPTGGKVRERGNKARSSDLCLRAGRAHYSTSHLHQD